MAEADVDASESRIVRRRSDPWEAAGTFFALLTVSSVLRVIWDALFEDVIDYEQAFMRSLLFAAVLAGLTMIFKTKAVFLPGR